MPGIPNSERRVLEIIENKGFTYTGNVPEVIELSYDKQKVKEVLGSLGIRVPYGAVLTPEEAAGLDTFSCYCKTFT
ncbi:MAG: hypothetical protein MZV63_42935 [Marinilabiliales bacterium]|nr:hypothetical protein [Marinilabiliales bacterium]